MIVLDLSILNQKGTPMFNSDLTANRPAAGIVGRIFIAIDSPYGIFRDTGTAWDQISSAGGGATIYTGDGTLTGTRTISSGGFQLVFNPQTTFFSSLTASTGASSFSVLGSNALTFAAGFSSSNIGNVYSANGAINAQNFLGNATFAQANLASAMVNVNKIDFGSGGHTITMTQSTAPGVRAMTGVQNQIQFTGSHNGTISHAAISQNLGFFRDTGSTRTLTITNAYSFLINPLDDYGAGFTFTNRWGIYQAGASDKNYFAANILAGSTTDNGQKLQVTGNGGIFTGGLEEIGNGQIGLRLQGSATNKEIWLSLKNTNASGKDYIFRSLPTGPLSIDIWDSATLTAVNIYTATNTYTQFQAGGTKYLFASDTAAFIPGLWIGVNAGSQTLANSTLLKNGTETYLSSPNFIRFYNGASFLGTIFTTTGNYVIQTGGTFTDAGFKFDIVGTCRIQSKLSLLGGTTSNAQINLASSTAPTSPNDGDIWFDGTNLFMRIGGLTKTFTII